MLSGISMIRILNNCEHFVVISCKTNATAHYIQFIDGRELAF